MRPFYFFLINIFRANGAAVSIGICHWVIQTYHYSIRMHPIQWLFIKFPCLTWSFIIPLKALNGSSPAHLTELLPPFTFSHSPGSELAACWRPFPSRGERPGEWIPVFMPVQRSLNKHLGPKIRVFMSMDCLRVVQLV